MEHLPSVVCSSSSVKVATQIGNHECLLICSYRPQHLGCTEAITAFLYKMPALWTDRSTWCLLCTECSIRSGHGGKAWLPAAFMQANACIQD